MSSEAAGSGPAPAQAGIQRIPVYLLTGFLGSGKTTLLKSWLAQPEFQDAALIINELGEVGLDNQLLSAASESSALIANACVCCTGLPGLEEALEELFWARLHRRIPPYPCVVIETTGLADPGPVLAALQSNELLQQRFQIAATITCLSAATADDVLPAHAEARAQLQEADLLVLTKTDLLNSSALASLQQRLRAAHPALTQATSSQASLSAAALLALLRASQPAVAGHHELEHEHEHQHEHEHEASAHWWPVPAHTPKAKLLAAIAQLQVELGPRLLRLKGRVLTDEGALLMQLVPFQSEVEVLPDPVVDSQQEDSAWGLTVIVANGSAAEQVAVIARVLNSKIPNR